MCHLQLRQEYSLGGRFWRLRQCWDASLSILFNDFSVANHYGKSLAEWVRAGSPLFGEIEAFFAAPGAVSSR
jgi:hypothetical protein